jgi:hypothetical protein
MTAFASADPVAAPRQPVADQLEPFCDDNLERFSDNELLDAYDIAGRWTHDLPTADIAVMNIAAEWHGRYGRNLPRVAPDLVLAQFTELAAQFDSGFWQLDETD